MYITKIYYDNMGYVDTLEQMNITLFNNLNDAKSYLLKKYEEAKEELDSYIINCINNSIDDITIDDFDVNAHLEQNHMEFSVSNFSDGEYIYGKIEEINFYNGEERK